MDTVVDTADTAGLVTTGAVGIVAVAAALGVGYAIAAWWLRPDARSRIVRSRAGSPGPDPAARPSTPRTPPVWRRQSH